MSVSKAGLLRTLRSRVGDKSGWRCWYCGVHLVKDIGEPNTLEVDHVIPRCRGGSEDLSNLVPCCGTCNSRKGRKSIENLRRISAGVPNIPPYILPALASLGYHDVEERILDRTKRYVFWFEDNVNHSKPVAVSKQDAVFKAMYQKQSAVQEEPKEETERICRERQELEVNLNEQRKNQREANKFWEQLGKGKIT